MIPSDRSAFVGTPLPRSPRLQPPHISRIRLRACATSAPLDKLLHNARHKLSRTGLEITSMNWDSRVLTLFITRENGGSVSADDCVDASTLIGQIIEQESYLGDAAYTLQVSTPGTADVLTELHEMEAFRGFPVHVNTIDVGNGKKEFWGTLGECCVDFVRIAVKGRVVKLKQQDVQEIMLCTAQQVQDAHGRK